MNTYLDLMILLTGCFFGLYYYKFSTSQNGVLKEYAFLLKISLLILSFVLAFIEKDFIVLGNLAFGGRTSVIVLIIFEIVDAFVDRKEG